MLSKEPPTVSIGAMLPSAIDPELLTWRERYLESLQAPRGWWSVVGLAWFGVDAADLGSTNPELGLSKSAPACFARIERRAAGARLERLGVTPLWLDGQPLNDDSIDVSDGAILSLGATAEAPALVFLQRGERFGVRVFDPAAGRASDLSALAWFAAAPQWRITAPFIPASEGETVPIINILGDVSEAPIAGRIHVEHEGGSALLIARPKPDGLMLHFRDSTSGRETMGSYGAGRFLHVDPPEGGRVVVDFNRAYQPPCAHTPHATCPLPPLSNRLPFPVEAGERSA